MAKEASSADISQLVTLSLRNFVATVTINSPTNRNALSLEVQAELRCALARAREDPDVRVIVLTGAGDKVFAAGADLRQLRDYSFNDGLAGRLQGLLDELEAIEKPTIAAINGFALGGGFELALACDIRIAAQHARLGLPETALSMIPGAGGTQRLARVVGYGRAVEMILTGRVVDADQALQWGLVSDVSETADLLETVGHIADRVAQRGPLAIRLAKLATRTGMDTDLRSAQVIERLSQALLHTTSDKQEGIAAFLDKREPRFEGR